MAKRKVADMVCVDGEVARLPGTVAKLPLDRVQSIVGGYIEHAKGIVKGTELWCNEEGWLLRLPYNRTASEWTGHTVAGDAIVEYFEDVE